MTQCKKIASSTSAKAPSDLKSDALLAMTPIMKLRFKPETSYEKFGMRVYNLLVDNSNKTFFVGGMVRDLLLHRRITDIDIATDLKPPRVAKILSFHGSRADMSFSKYGIVKVSSGKKTLEIATFRAEKYSTSRYPKVTFISNPRIDSQRRDFSINALYLRPKTGTISDFNHGADDIEQGLIRFIGKPKKRIQEDPLRIARAIRFALILKFKFHKDTFRAIKNNFHLLQRLSENRIATELGRIKNKKLKLLAQKVINNPKALDKIFI